MSSTVSVVIPTYYRNDSLRRAIESALRQTYEPIEVVVVDDSGEAHAREAVADYDVEYVAHEENKLANGARTTGIEATSGKYVQLLDDDDVIFESKIEKQVALLESNPDVGVAYGGIRSKTGDDIYPDPQWPDDSLRCALGILYQGTFPSSMLIERDVIEKILPLTPRPSADDIGTKIELARHTEFDYVDEILTQIGVSETHISGSPEFGRDIKNIIQEYSHLYDRYPESLRKAAKSFMYEAYAVRALNASLWSPSATAAFLKAAYYDQQEGPGSDRPVLVATAVLSLFGRPAVTMASRARGVLSRDSGPSSDSTDADPSS
jgi:glycosyltransferase involved in cell wall biosynthesis